MTTVEGYSQHSAILDKIELNNVEDEDYQLTCKSLSNTSNDYYTTALNESKIEFTSPAQLDVEPWYLGLWYNASTSKNPFDTNESTAIATNLTDSQGFELNTLSVSSEYLQMAAILSNAAYGNAVYGNQSWQDQQAATVALAIGWRALDYSDLGAYSTALSASQFIGGYFNVLDRQAFIAEGIIDGERVVTLAFRGTTPEETIDISTDLFLWSDAYTIFSAIFIQTGLIEAVQNYANNTGARLLITGHSLGGAFAEVYMANNFDPTTIGITFGSPGGQLGYPPLPAQGELLNIGHGGDPVFNFLNPNTNGVDVSVSRPDIPDLISGTLGLIQLGLLSATTGELWEHDPINYIQSAEALANSRFYDAFAPAIQTYQIEIVSMSGGAFSLVAGTNKVIFIGSPDKDNIIGSQLNDVLEGRDGNDLIVGDDGNDKIDGGVGHDQITGGAGNDLIYGGSGYDTAIYTGAISQYAIFYHADGNTEYLTIAPADGAPNIDGIDTLYGIERLQFLDATLTWQQAVQIATGGTSAGSGSGTYNPNAIAGDLPNNSTTPYYAIVSPGTSSVAGVRYQGIIETANDKDYVRVYLQEGVTYEIRVDGIALNGYGALIDTFFRIRDGRDPNVLQPMALAPTNSDTHDQVNGLNAAVDFTAPYSGLFFISIGGGGPNFATLTGGYEVSVMINGVVPPNQNPTTANYIFDATLGNVISGNVLTGAADPDGDMLAVNLLNDITTTAGGRVTLLANGGFQYQAPANGTSDSFTFTVVDGAGGSATGTVSINLTEFIPALPVFTNDSDIVTLPDYRGPYYGLGGNDVFTGSPTGSTAFGGEGADTFIVGSGDYDYIGGPGSDLFIAGPGRTDIWGDELTTSSYGDIDTVDFSGAQGGIYLELLNGTVEGTPNIGFTRLTGIEAIIGTAFDDTIYGDNGANQLFGTGGIDLLIGLDGDDLLDGGSGNDNLNGGIGNDSIFGGAGNDDLDGGSGNDQIEGGDGNDFLYGGDGNDVLFGGDGDDFIAGENGDDTIFASGGNDILRGFAGVDIVDYSLAPGRLTGQFSDSSQVSMSVEGWGTGRHETIEILIATSFDDDISADQSVQAVWLGDGNDRITADGLTLVVGGNGNDLIIALNTESAMGGNGNDDIRILGAAGNVFGEAGDDTLYGGSQADVMDGGDGADIIFGGGGADELYGGLGADLLSGGEGADMLDGGAGDDIFVVGEGNDIVTSGSGADVIQLIRLSGITTISDFEIGVDRIDFSQLSQAVLVNDGRCATQKQLADAIVFIQFGTSTIAAIEKFSPKGTPADYSMTDAIIVFENTVATDLSVVDDFIWN